MKSNKALLIFLCFAFVQMRVLSQNAVTAISKQHLPSGIKIAQDNIPVYSEGSLLTGLPDMANYAAGKGIFTTDSVKNIKSFSGDEDLIFVKDSLRGGFFYRYNGLKTADNGIVFADALDRKWHRYMSDNAINVCWYGLKAADGNFDNYSSWLSMVNSITRIRQEEGYNFYTWKAEFVFPPSEHFYFFSNTLNVDYNMVIRGGTASQKFRQYSKLLFAPNTTGFNVRYPADNISGVSSTLIKDLFIAAVPAKKMDSTKHGINSNAPVFIENVSVTKFSGHGINIQSPQGTPLVGIADLSSVKRCMLTFNYDGLHLEGADGNACLVEECNLSLNRRWGLNDMSFLGNTFIANHAASNCNVPGQRSMVCMQPFLPADKTFYTYAAKRAGTNLKKPRADAEWEEDWYEFGTPGCVWGDAGSFVYGAFYEPGGAYSLDNRLLGNQNQRGLLIGCYAEGDQPPSYVGNKSISIGGIVGNGLSVASPRIEANEGKLYVNKLGIRTDAGDMKIYGMINQLGVTVQKETGEGLRMTYDTTFRMGRFLDQKTGESATFITSDYSNANYFSRKTMEPGKLLNTGGLYFANATDRNRIKFFDITNEKPAVTASTEIGDIRLATSRGYNDVEPADDAIYKVINPAGDGSTKVWTTVKGSSQHLKKTNDTTATIIETTYNVTRSLKLYISGSCTDGAGNYYFFKKLFRVVSNGSKATLVAVENLETEVKSPGFATAGINLLFNGIQVSSIVHGVKADWQLYITREKQ